MDGLIAVTYRCNARCHMCNTWQFPTEPIEEITAADLESLPRLEFANITGGEPFLREDLQDIVRVVLNRADRVVISTNGYFTEQIVDLARAFPQVGFRVSLEGLPKANDTLRGLPDGFDHGLRTLLRLMELGRKDVGFGITVSDRNADDLLDLYELARVMKVEFATAVVHNSFYFHKMDNAITDVNRVTRNLEALAERLLRTTRPKNWYRAWFNMGLANYARGGARLLPCRMGESAFFIDPFGRVLPCNALDASMGSIKNQSFDEIWKSEAAELVRCSARQCGRDCWMIGSVAPVMRQNLLVPSKWIVRAKVSRNLPPVGSL